MSLGTAVSGLFKNSITRNIEEALSAQGFTIDDLKNGSVPDSKIEQVIYDVYYKMPGLVTSLVNFSDFKDFAKELLPK